MARHATIEAALLLLLLICFRLCDAAKPKASAANAEARERVANKLFRAAHLGDVAAIRAMFYSKSDAPFINLSHTMRNEGVLVQVMTGWHLSTESYPQPRPANMSHADVLAFLLAKGADASISCPILDAVVQRNAPAARVLLGAMTPKGITYCLTAFDSTGQGAFHAAARSPASGFARLLFRLRAGEAAEAATAPSSDRGSGELRRTPAELMQHLNFRAPRWSAWDDISKSAIDAASGDSFLGLLLDAAEVAFSRGGLVLNESLNQRDEEGASPLVTACAQGQAGAVRRLLAWSSKFGLELDGLASGCLHAAAAGAHVDVFDAVWQHVQGANAGPTTTAAATAAADNDLPVEVFSLGKARGAPVGVPVTGAASEPSAAATAALANPPASTSSSTATAAAAFDRLLHATDRFGRAVRQVARAHGPTHAVINDWIAALFDGSGDGVGSNGVGGRMAPSLADASHAADDGALTQQQPFGLARPSRPCLWNTPDLERWAAAHAAAGWAMAPREHLRAILGDACTTLLLGSREGCARSSSNNNSSDISVVVDGSISTSSGHRGGSDASDDTTQRGSSSSSGAASSQSCGKRLSSVVEAVGPRIAPIDEIEYSAEDYLGAAGGGGGQPQTAAARRRRLLLRRRLISDYLSIEKPVMLLARGRKTEGTDPSSASPPSSSMATAPSSTITRFRPLSCASLLSWVGNLTVEAGAIPYASSYGLGNSTTRTTVRRFVLKHMANSTATAGSDGCCDDPPDSAALPQPPYVFDGMVMFQHSGVFRPELPPVSLFEKAVIADLVDAALNASSSSSGGSGEKPRPQRPHLQQFMLGPALSGSMPHFHGAAVNRLLFGLKLWVLLPPASAEFSRAHAHAWFARVYRDKYGVSVGVSAGANTTAADGNCRIPVSEGANSAAEAGSGDRTPPVHYLLLQGPGDVVFVPPMWGHAVLNLADSAAIAIE